METAIGLLGMVLTPRLGRLPASGGGGAPSLQFRLSAEQSKHTDRARWAPKRQLKWPLACQRRGGIETGAHASPCWIAPLREKKGCAVSLARRESMLRTVRRCPEPVSGERQDTADSPRSKTRSV